MSCFSFITLPHYDSGVYFYSEFGNKIALWVFLFNGKFFWDYNRSSGICYTFVGNKAFLMSGIAGCKHLQGSAEALSQMF